MKKGVVVLLIVAALVVLVTPGIIGRLAEESFDQNLEMAVTDNDDVVVSSLGFVRGWFTSEGQHRIELRKRKLLADPDPADAGRRFVEALIVTTRIDHGVIPVTSMARDEGSLAPGLGSAVSTLSLEISDGTTFDLPGTIYSEVGLTGVLQSNYLLEADSQQVEDRLVDWGDADVVVTSNPASGEITARGDIRTIGVAAPQERFRISDFTFDGEQRPGPFGYPLWSGRANLGLFSVDSFAQTIDLGPIAIESSLTADDDRVNGHAVFEMTNLPSMLGPADVTWHARLEGADGEALGNITTLFDALTTLADNPQDADKIAASFVGLFAEGLTINFDRLDVTLEQGSFSSKMNLTVHENGADIGDWVRIIMALDGTLELSLTQGLVDLMAVQVPELNGAIALGYLRKSGDLYETLVEIRSGVITINGAPMQIPLEMFQ